MILLGLAAKVVLCVFKKKKPTEGSITIFGGLEGKWLEPTFSGVTKKANLNPRATAGELSTV